ncbi:hypothetical protein D9M68_815190 [compost metagenome]
MFRVRLPIDGDDVPAPPSKQLVETEVLQMPAVREINEARLFVEAKPRDFAQKIETTWCVMQNFLLHQSRRLAQPVPQTNVQKRKEGRVPRRRQRPHSWGRGSARDCHGSR